jgi:hypothetical protein
VFIFMYLPSRRGPSANVGPVCRKKHLHI